MKAYNYSKQTAEQYLPQMAGRAINEWMQNLSDAEIDRVFGQCVMAGFCIRLVTQFREAGGTLPELLKYNA